jgi:hypothetical protein
LERFEIKGFKQDHGLPEVLATFTLTHDGTVEFDHTVGHPPFIATLEREGVGRIEEPTLKPSDGKPFVQACLEVYSLPGLLCSQIGAPAAASNDIAPPDSGTTHPLMADLLACTADQFEDVLGSYFCAPDSSERSSDPPPSDKSAA